MYVIVHVHLVLRRLKQYLLDMLKRHEDNIQHIYCTVFYRHGTVRPTQIKARQYN